MAEIKSTLDMVMERAARLAAEAPAVSIDNTVREQGMRLAVSYLNGETTDLMALVQGKPQQQQMEIRSGMATTLLRNIILPRGGNLSEQTTRSFTGLLELSGNAPDISAICSELKQILDQYNRHRDQVKQQFDDSMLNQLKMNLHQQGLAVDDRTALSPTMHPQYQEEWTRVSAELNSQYNQAMDQRKHLIAQRFSSSSS